MAIMKALTIWQPWATLIAIGAKPYEFRGWRPPRALIGERIAIHAGARPMKLIELRDLLNGLVNPAEYGQPCLHAEIALPFLQRLLDNHHLKIPHALPLSHIMCTAVLGESKSGADCAREFGEVAGNDSDREGTFNWGWSLTDIEAMTPPEPARGAQGFWNWRGA